MRDSWARVRVGAMRAWLGAAAVACAGVGVGSGGAQGVVSGAATGEVSAEQVGAKEELPVAVREYRGAWVATVSNIDWPSKPGLSVAEMRAQMQRVLDSAQALKLNMLVLQVRPSCDAVYPSTLEPWSEFVTGACGKAPEDPGFDPLAEWIAGAHARGIELHAWFNPFRAKHFSAKSSLPASHVANTMHESVRSYDNMLWLDPGDARAREHVMRVILDVVNRYDIDGVHLDDYFYPYPKKDQPFPDDATFQRYQTSGGKLVRDDWRRANIDTFVRELTSRVHASKAHVRVGISPFGIWRPGNPAGVKGFDAYAGLYADARTWLREGWVDYMVPQLYWRIGSPEQSYQDLLTWWTRESVRGRPVLAGLIPSRVGEGKGGKAWSASDITNQVEVGRAITKREATLMQGVGGSIHFSMIALMDDRQGVATALKQGAYREAAVVPEMAWLAGSSPRPGLVMASATRQADRSVRVQAGAMDASRVVVWVKSAGASEWKQVGTFAAGTAAAGFTLGADVSAGAQRVAAAGLDRFGRLGPVASVEVGSANP